MTNTVMSRNIHPQIKWISVKIYLIFIIFQRGSVILAEFQFCFSIDLKFIEVSLNFSMKFVRLGICNEFLHGLLSNS
jgi:hypothetical protein